MSGAIISRGLKADPENMPELSGVEFITALRERGNNDVPIVMITGHADRELQRDALKRGASAFLGKPVDPVKYLPPS